MVQAITDFSVARSPQGGPTPGKLGSTFCPADKTYLVFHGKQYWQGVQLGGRPIVISVGTTFDRIFIKCARSRRRTESSGGPGARNGITAVAWAALGGRADSEKECSDIAQAASQEAAIAKPRGRVRKNPLQVSECLFVAGWTLSGSPMRPEPTAFLKCA